MRPSPGHFLALVQFTMLWLLALSTTGCAGLRAAHARSLAYQQALDAYVWPVSAEDLIATTNLVLIEQGYAPREIGRNVIETDASYRGSSDVNGSSGTFTRYTATAIKLPRGTHLSIVETDLRHSSGVGGSSVHRGSSRAYELELQVLRRVDPMAASRIELEAEDRAREARSKRRPQRAARAPDPHPEVRPVISEG